MPNRLLLRDKKYREWGKVTAKVFWQPNGQDSVWVNESGIGEFPGSGVVSHIVVAEETITILKKVDGDSTITAVSRREH